MTGERNAFYRDDAPGAVLDREPWAKSWATYLRAVFDARDPSVRQYIANAMGERIPAEGGFLVPEILRSQVMDYMAPAIMRPRATVLPMSSLRLPVPTLDNPSQASSTQVLGGLTFSFTEEGSAIAATTSQLPTTTLPPTSAPLPRRSMKVVVTVPIVPAATTPYWLNVLPLMRQARPGSLMAVTGALNQLLSICHAE